MSAQGRVAPRLDGERVLLLPQCVFVTGALLVREAMDLVGRPSEGTAVAGFQKSVTPYDEHVRSRRGVRGLVRTISGTVASPSSVNVGPCLQQEIGNELSSLNGKDKRPKQNYVEDPVRRSEIPD